MQEWPPHAAKSLFWKTKVMKCIVYTGTTASMDPALTDRLVDAACDFHYHECKFTPEMAPKLRGHDAF